MIDGPWAWHPNNNETNLEIAQVAGERTQRTLVHWKKCAPNFLVFGLNGIWPNPFIRSFLYLAQFLSLVPFFPVNWRIFSAMLLWYCIRHKWHSQGDTIIYSLLEHKCHPCPGGICIRMLDSVLKDMPCYFIFLPSLVGASSLGVPHQLRSSLSFHFEANEYNEYLLDKVHHHELVSKPSTPNTAEKCQQRLSSNFLQTTRAPLGLLLALISDSVYEGGSSLVVWARR